MSAACFACHSLSYVHSLLALVKLWGCLPISVGWLCAFLTQEVLMMLSFRAGSFAVSALEMHVSAIWHKVLLSKVGLQAS